MEVLPGLLPEVADRIAQNDQEFLPIKYNRPLECGEAKPDSA